MKTIVLIITKNELENIKLYHKEIQFVCSENGYDFIYIDGHSIDGSIQFFKKNNIPFIVQNYFGRGGAIRTGFEKIDSDRYIIFSPDGNENVYDIPKFEKYLNQGNELVIASRMMKGSRNEEDSNFFKFRKWANNVFNFFANIFFNKEDYITDSINGFRAITKNAFDLCEITAYDYTIEYQMTIRCMKKKIKIAEFPTIESDRKFGKSGAPSIPTGIAFLKRLFCEVFLD